MRTSFAADFTWRSHALYDFECRSVQAELFPPPSLITRASNSVSWTQILRGDDGGDIVQTVSRIAGRLEIEAQLQIEPKLGCGAQGARQT